mmetsp:Transcript_77277/g.202765  ORF Transcript_77277/g.202765 Transcript_77277/m.202765 type:complete len:222 (-) Transcript_77277:887-1552(-)
MSSSAETFSSALVSSSFVQYFCLLSSSVCCLSRIAMRLVITPRAPLVSPGPTEIDSTVAFPADSAMDCRRESSGSGKAVICTKEGARSSIDRKEASLARPDFPRKSIACAMAAFSLLRSSWRVSQAIFLASHSLLVWPSIIVSSSSCLADLFSCAFAFTSAILVSVSFTSFSALSDLADSTCALLVVMKAVSMSTFFFSSASSSARVFCSFSRMPFMMPRT